MSLPSVPIKLKFDNTLGAVLIGGLVSAVLYGITTLQTYTYFHTRRRLRDPLYFKCTIIFLWLFDTFIFGLSVHMLYWFMVINFTNILAIAIGPWSVRGILVGTVVNDFVIRLLYVQRVWRFSKNKWLATVGISMSLFAFAVGVVMVVKIFNLDLYQTSRVSIYFFLNFASGIAADVLVATSLSYFLIRQRNGFKRTDSMLNTLVLYAVGTGFFTIATQAAGTIMYALQPDNLIFMAIYHNLSKVYLNAYLALINVSDGLRETDGEPVSIHLSKLAHSYEIDQDSAAAPSPRDTNMNVATRTDTDPKTDSDQTFLVA